MSAQDREIPTRVMLEFDDLRPEGGILHPLQNTVVELKCNNALATHMVIEPDKPVVEEIRGTALAAPHHFYLTQENNEPYARRSSHADVLIRAIRPALAPERPEERPNVIFVADERPRLECALPHAEFTAFMQVMALSGTINAIIRFRVLVYSNETEPSTGQQIFGRRGVAISGELVSIQVKRILPHA